MPWWIYLVVELVKDLPGIVDWIKNHPGGKKPAIQALKAGLKEFTKRA